MHHSLIKASFINKCAKTLQCANKILQLLQEGESSRKDEDCRKNDPVAASSVSLNHTAKSLPLADNEKASKLGIYLS